MDNCLKNNNVALDILTWKDVQGYTTKKSKLQNSMFTRSPFLFLKINKMSIDQFMFANAL